jgi:hypothetical protein
MKSLSGKLRARRLEKRAEAEARNAEYQKLPLEQKLARNSKKVKAKLEATK